MYFESNNVKSDGPVQIFRKIIKDLIQTVGLPLLVSLFFFFEALVNWSFSELFYFIFFRPPDPKSEKKFP